MLLPVTYVSFRFVSSALLPDAPVYSQLLRMIRSGPRRFPREDLISLQEDLAELVGARGLVSVGQQLQIVQRVQRSYKFLLPRP